MSHQVEYPASTPPQLIVDLEPGDTGWTARSSVYRTSDGRWWLEYDARCWPTKPAAPDAIQIAHDDQGLPGKEWWVAWDIPDTMPVDRGTDHPLSDICVRVVPTAPGYARQGRLLPAALREPEPAPAPAPPSEEDMARDAAILAWADVLETEREDPLVTVYGMTPTIPPWERPSPPPPARARRVSPLLSSRRHRDPRITRSLAATIVLSTISIVTVLLFHFPNTVRWPLVAAGPVVLAWPIRLSTAIAHPTRTARAARWAFHHPFKLIAYLFVLTYATVVAWTMIVGSPLGAPLLIIAAAAVAVVAHQHGTI